MRHFASEWVWEVHIFLWVCLNGKKQWFKHDLYWGWNVFARGWWSSKPKAVADFLLIDSLSWYRFFLGIENIFKYCGTCLEFEILMRIKDWVLYKWLYLDWYGAQKHTYWDSKKCWWDIFFKLQINEKVQGRSWIILMCFPWNA